MPEQEAPDHYRTLLVQPTASQEEITTAWRGLVRAVHPDLSHDASDKERRTAVAAQVNAAYTVLRDPATRAAYDLDRQAAAESRAAHRRASRNGAGPGDGTKSGAPGGVPATPADAGSSSGAASIARPIIAFGDWLLRDALGQWIAVALLCLPFGYSLVSHGRLGDIAPMLVASLLVLGFAQVLRVGRFAGTPMGTTWAWFARAARAAWRVGRYGGGDDGR